MGFAEKLTTLRKQTGMSQEQLADRLGVTRQSVSKWESSTAMPELGKLIAISELFDVTVDYLVKDYMESSDGGGSGETDTARLERKLDDLYREHQMSFGPLFQYTSRTRAFGVPLVSIRFGRDRQPTRYNTAVGIIAIGNFAVGAVSIGLISVGILSVGMIALGGLALGVVAIGFGAFGVSALGAYAAGVAAVGHAAIGIAAVRNMIDG